MDTLLGHLARWKPFTAIVVGDFMLDQMLYGDAERLAADAPVPILRVRRAENRAGGAANLCLDLAAMKGRVLAFGVVGEDGDAGQLKRELETQGVDVSGIVTDAERPTTVKRYMIGLASQRHPQKMFRVDHESREPLSDEVVEEMLARFESALAGADVVCIEDYNKGVCSEALCQGVIRLAKKAGKPVLVDPAMLSSYAKYTGATAITPNRNEAEIATTMPTAPDADTRVNGQVSARLLEQLACEAVVLTLDRHGALLHRRGSEPIGVPTVAREVYDVTGAGDMMLAGLAAAKANGMGWLDAVRFANAAAGLEVEVFGVMPIPLERIHHSLMMQHSGSAGKVRDAEQLRVEAASRRQQGQRIVFTNGCFDVVHSGHVKLIEQASKLGDFLVVAINADASVSRLKGPGRPVNNQDDRARVLGAFESVGAVVVFEEDTPERLLEMLRPDVLVKGGDYSREGVVGGDFVESYGGRVVLIPPVEGVSTTKTIEKMGG
ncbi:MAG: D-glycero-beta-D-manno-heptose 1-phosphate adenylyltransferase [Phycisphaerales bacterium]|nr:D-glycero-beta-D-manno-heptose 1-phosphate adenylyltransferase [Phycisphaerales bacterium]